MYLPAMHGLPLKKEMVFFDIVIKSFLEVNKLWTKNGSALCSSRAQYSAAGSGFHSCPKTMRSFTLYVAWLKCAFHRCVY